MKYPFTSEQMCLLGLARTTWRRRASAKRHNLHFGEETITDTVLMDLVDLFPGRVSVLPFNKRKEGKEGADWAWAFESSDGSKVMPMLVQAKVLDQSDIEYPEIKRTVGRTTPKIRQIDLLIETAKRFGWPAIYAFYNHLNDPSRVPKTCGSLMMYGLTLPESWGISIADSYRVRAALNDQTFDTHRQHSIPLHCLLCTRAAGDSISQSSPELALRAITSLRDSIPLSEGDYVPLMSTPLREMPDLFRKAEAAASIEDDAERVARRDALSEQYPELAGVVLLRDVND